MQKMDLQMSALLLGDKFFYFQFLCTFTYSEVLKTSEVSLNVCNFLKFTFYSHYKVNRLEKVMIEVSENSHNV